MRDLDATPIKPAVVIRTKWFYGQGLEPPLEPGYETLVTDALLADRRRLRPRAAGRAEILTLLYLA